MLKKIKPFQTPEDYARLWLPFLWRDPREEMENKDHSPLGWALVVFQCPGALTTEGGADHQA